MKKARKDASESPTTKSPMFELDYENRNDYVRFECYLGNWGVAVYHNGIPKKPAKEEEYCYSPYLKLEKDDYDVSGEPLLAHIDRKYRSKLVAPAKVEPKIKLPE